MTDATKTQVVLAYSDKQTAVMGSDIERALLAVALVKDVVAERDRLRQAIRDAWAEAKEAEDAEDARALYDILESLAKQVDP